MAAWYIPVQDVVFNHYVPPTPSGGTYEGIGSPEGVLTAPAGSIYIDIAVAGSPVQYIKGSGSGNTGWV